MVLSRDMDQKKKKYRILLMQLSCAVLLASDAAAWEYFLFATAGFTGHDEKSHIVS